MHMNLLLIFYRTTIESNMWWRLLSARWRGREGAPTPGTSQQQSQQPPGHVSPPSLTLWTVTIRQVFQRTRSTQTDRGRAFSPQLWPSSPPHKPTTPPIWTKTHIGIKETSLSTTHIKQFIQQSHCRRVCTYTCIWLDNMFKFHTLLFNVWIYFHLVLLKLTDVSISDLRLISRWWRSLLNEWIKHNSMSFLSEKYFVVVVVVVYYNNVSLFCFITDLSQQHSYLSGPGPLWSGTFGFGAV